MENSNKVPYDPGWNDPPLFSYDSHATQIKQEKRGNLLNKRVAFPLQKDGATPPNLADLPPPCTPPLPSATPRPSTVLTPSCNIVPKQSSDQCEETVLGEDALISVVDNLNTALNSMSENRELQEKVPEIHRRIGMLEKLWKEGKFSTTMKRKILKLSEAIRSCNSETADHIQRGLMVDHAALCSSWMSGLRHLIHAATETKLVDQTPATEDKPL